MAKKRKAKGWGFQIFIVMSVLLSIIFSAMAIIFVIGMIPTFVSWFVDKTKGRARTFTIAAMNFAGCTPFVIEVFNKGNNIEMAINYICEPRTIVVIYFAAGMGYLIDWSMTGIVSSFAIESAKKRLKQIEKEKAAIIERWGPEVTGKMLVDKFGFPLLEHSSKEEGV